MIGIEFFIGCVLLIAGVAATAYPRDTTYITRLINMEVAEFGLVFIMLAFNEMLALVTFIAVNIVTTLIFVRLIEKRAARDERPREAAMDGGASGHGHAEQVPEQSTEHMQPKETP